MKNWLHDPIYFAPVAKLGGGWIVFKDSPSAPPTPDYGTIAMQQGAANVETARAQGRMSNPNIITPYGTQTVTWGSQGRDTPRAPTGSGGSWSQPVWDPGSGGSWTEPVWNPGSGGSWTEPVWNPGSGGDDNGFWTEPVWNPGSGGSWSQPVWDPGSGGDDNGFWIQPQWTPSQEAPPANDYANNYANDQATIIQTLAPEQQALLDSQNRISQNLAGVAERGLNRIDESMATPWSTEGMQQVSADPEARRHAEDMAYQQDVSRLDPQWAKLQAAQDTQLANQGIQRGSEAYNDAMRQFGLGRNDAYSQARANAVGQGLTNQQAQFGMGQSLRQQQIQEQAYRRQLPMNELNSLRTGAQVQNPQFQSYQGPNLAGTPIFGAAQAQNQAAQQQYAQQMGASNATMSGLFGLGAAATRFSDRRLKSNIKRIGTHPLGVGIYEYDIFEGHDVGVMADEVENVLPEAVLLHPSGYKMVNYSMLGV